MLATTAIIAAVNFLSAFTQASTGFGYAIVAMFLMPYFLPFRQCSLISAAVIIAIALQMTVKLRKHLRFRKVLLPMAFCLSTTWFGVYAIQLLDQAMTRKIMGGFLVFLSVYFYLIKRYNITTKQTAWSGAAVGVLTGLSTGMFNIVGPFLTLYYFDVFDTTLEFKANIELSFLAAGAFSLLLNAAYTGIDGFTALNALASSAAALAAGGPGLRLYRRLDKEKLKIAILCVLPVMGLIQIVK